MEIGCVCRQFGRCGRAVAASATVVAIAVAAVVFSQGSGWADEHSRPVPARVSWQALSKGGLRTEQLAADTRSRDGVPDSEMGKLNPDTGYPYGYTHQQIEYGQWWRAASLRKWYGVPGRGHEHDQTDKMQFITRRDCAAAVEYHIEHIAKDCRFPCGACQGSSYRASCSLLTEGYCAGCQGCPLDYHRVMCGGPRLPTELEYDPQVITSFADVLAVTLNSTELGLEGKCVPCAQCQIGEYRQDCGDQNPGVCGPCGQCEDGQWRAGCGYTNPGECKPCEVCRAGEYIPDCHYVTKGSCRPCSTCNETEYQVQACTATVDTVRAPCSDLPLCQAGFFREGCGFGNEGSCVPCRGTQPGFYRVDCGPADFPLDGGHVVQCDECQAGYFRDGCGGPDTPLSPGICTQCEDCGTDYWRKGCGNPYISPGECQPCQDCGQEKFLTGCEYLSPGICNDCTQCSADEYMVTDCSQGADRICAPCTSLPACPEGQYREGCGAGSEGECVTCPVPPVGFYHVECGGLSPGRDVRCSECSEGHFNFGCKDTSPGECKPCGECNAGEYRMDCGTWINPGHCEPCQECPVEHHLVDCKGLSPGSCLPCYECARDEYETLPCSNEHDRECSKCSQLPPCDAGHYRADCGLGSQGVCKECAPCPEGSFRQGCGGDSPGICAACGECPEGQYRFGCDESSPGECRDCADCPAGSYRVGCLGLDEGHCEACTVCGEHEYESRECSGTNGQHHDRQCLPCDSLSCAPGLYRKGCGKGPEGLCTICPDECEEGDFLVGCGGQSPGTCGPCALDCEDRMYRKGCEYLDAGECTDCPVCPEGFFSRGCGGLHAGACIACDSLPCPPGTERVECGGTEEGICQQVWLPYTPPPETILWAKYLTVNPTPDCIDNGGNDIPGVTREFKITNSILRLAACTEATVEGRYELKAKGKWLVSFYVGVPVFDESPVKAPAAYPLEKQGKPDPADSLEVTINGISQTFKNELDPVEGNKLVFYHEVADTRYIDFKFVFKSSTDQDHLHLFASTGTAAFWGDILPLNQARRSLIHHVSPGSLEGKVLNAVDGFKIKGGKRIKVGYKVKRKTVRMQLPHREADVKLMRGSSLWKDLTHDQIVKQGNFLMIPVIPGDYACYASFPGFYTAFDPECTVESDKRLVHDMVLCPYLNPGHGRFILTWGAEPKDMDLYIDAPDGKGGRCTVMWQDKYCQDMGNGRRTETRIHLDLDVTQSFGPETVTVEGFLEGEYIIRVKHYRGYGCVDKRTNFDQCLADSHAMVSFYMDIQQYFWHVDKDGYTHGIQWVIAKINGATREVTMCTPEICPPVVDQTDNY